MCTFTYYWLLLHWYTKQIVSVRWGGTTSGPSSVSNGVRQGSVLSPHLFGMYMDLNSSYKGCCINDTVVNHLLFADDICSLVDIIIMQSHLH